MQVWATPGGDWVDWVGWTLCRQGNVAVAWLSLHGMQVLISKITFQYSLYNCIVYTNIYLEARSVSIPFTY